METGADPKTCVFIKDRFDPGFNINKPIAYRVCGMV